VTTAKPITFFLLAAAVLGNSCSVAADRGHCSFRYSRSTAEELVVPELKENFSGAYIYFDFDQPVTFWKRGEFVVQLSATRIINGRTLGFEDLFFVEIDPCTKKVLRSYATQQYHKE